MLTKDMTKEGTVLAELAVPGVAPRWEEPEVRSRPSQRTFEIAVHPSEKTGSEGGEPPFDGQRVVVEVDETAVGDDAGLPEEAPETVATEMARRTALQIVQKDLPHEVEPACSVMVLPHLPDGLRDQPPALSTSDTRAWLA